MTQRSDAPLIKHLTQTYGPETAKDWQRPPLVVLPGDGFTSHLGAEAEAAEAREGGMDEFRSALPDIFLRPWADVVFDYRDGHTVLAHAIERQFRTQMEELRALPDDQLPSTPLAQRDGSVAYFSERSKLERNLTATIDWAASMSAPWCFVRMRGVENYLAHQSRSSPFGPTEQFFRDLAGEYLGGNTAKIYAEQVVLEVWEYRQSKYGRMGFGRHPTYVLMHAGNPWGAGLEVPCTVDVCDCAENPAFRRIRQQFNWAYSRLVMHTLRYLMGSDQYLTKVTPAPKPVPKNQAKVHEAKPWLNESLPHYILLDPTRAAEYGHPSGVRAPVGHHASPHPHTRRGHWAVLRHEKFARDEDGSPRRIWVKQAWVGDQEWISEGQRYRVVLPTEQPVATQQAKVRA